MKTSFVVLIVIIFCSSIYSQEDSTNLKYALSFGIADNFRLDKFNMDIAVKKIIDETHQLRLFLSPRVSTSNEDQSRENQSNEINSSSYSLGIGTDYLWIVMKNKEINMFSGTGLAITYGKSNYENISIDNNGNKSIHEQDIPFINLGIRGTLGVEWKVSDKIGIHSEYLLTGLYEWSKIEHKSSSNNVDNPTETRKTTSILLITYVLFGVSIYL